MPPISKERYDTFLKFLWFSYGKKRKTLSEFELKVLVSKGLGINTGRKTTWDYHLNKLLSENVLMPVEKKKGTEYRVVSPTKSSDFLDYMRSVLEEK